MNIYISNTALQRIAYLVAQENSTELLRLRLSVFGGGCSGFQYNFTLDSVLNPDDSVLEKEGVGVVIDAASLSLLEGCEIDYVEDLSSASFVIKNPNAASSCGCGNSFSV